MNRQNVERRMLDIPEPIWEVARDNAACYHVAQLYAHGEIITKEEMLCKMIIYLAKDWQKFNTELMEKTFQLTAQKLYVPDNQ